MKIAIPQKQFRVSEEMRAPTHVLLPVNVRDVLAITILTINKLIQRIFRERTLVHIIISNEIRTFQHAKIARKSRFRFYFSAFNAFALRARACV